MKDKVKIILPLDCGPMTVTVKIDRTPCKPSLVMIVGPVRNQ